MQTVLYIGIAMAAGLLFNRLAKRINLPNVTGYLVAGLLIGPHILGVLPEAAVESMTIVSQIALGFIAFSIGAEFKISSIRAIGGSVIVITMMQALLAAAAVMVTLIVLGYDLPLALTLGAIATATAPAATLLVIKQYNARGPVTNILLPVVALDDAVGLILFAVILAVSQALASGAELTVRTMLIEPLIEIFGSLGAGAALGAALSIGIRFFKSRANRTTVVCCAVFLGAAIADLFGLSSLLLCMMISAVLVNTNRDSGPIMECCDRWTPPLFLLFFVISGAELDITVLPSVGAMGVAYILSRSLGKYFGAYFGAVVTKKQPEIRKYLGFTLLPQAGVAIGMSLIVMSSLPQYGAQIRAVTLAATLVYELAGPLITKIALTKAGEISK